MQHVLGQRQVALGEKDGKSATMMVVLVIAVSLLLELKLLR